MIDHELLERAWAKAGDHVDLDEAAIQLDPSKIDGEEMSALIDVDMDALASWALRLAIMHRHPLMPVRELATDILVGMVFGITAVRLEANG